MLKLSALKQIIHDEIEFVTWKKSISTLMIHGAGGLEILKTQLFFCMHIILTKQNFAVQKMITGFVIGLIIWF